MIRSVLPLCLAALAAGCADAVTGPLPPVPRPGSDILAVLRGRTEGVRVTQATPTGTVIRVRCGGSSFPPDVQPLVIVDGVRMEQVRLMDLALDPDKIVDIEILRGTAATQRYGPAAGHGVVLIRTRSAAPAAGP